MSLGGFLQGLGVAYGNSLIYGTQVQTQKADLQVKQAEAAQMQMQTKQMQQHMKTEQDLGSFLQSQAKLEGANASNPLEQAKMYQKAAGMAAAAGDFTSSAQMSKLAEAANNEGRQAAVEMQRQQQVKKEDLANTADGFMQNPTQQGAQDLVRKAVAAGVNPATIPLPNSPQFASWVNQQKLAGMDSKSRAQFVQKAADLKANRDLKMQEHQDNVMLRQATMQSTASYRDASTVRRLSPSVHRSMSSTRTGR
jgi:hypothetical protein